MLLYSILTNTRSFIKAVGRPEGRTETFILIYTPNVDSVQSFIMSIQRFVFWFRISYDVLYIDVLYRLYIKIRDSSIISTHTFFFPRFFLPYSWFLRHHISCCCECELLFGFSIVTFLSKSRCCVLWYKFGSYSVSMRSFSVKWNVTRWRSQCQFSRTISFNDEWLSQQYWSALTLI
jgi:hypothetical protein